MADVISSTTLWPADMMKNYQWLDEYLQSQKVTEKEFNSSWQAYKYMLNRKMYAYIGIDDRNKRPIVTMKLEPVFSEMLRGEYTDIVPGYYMNKIHWSSVYLDGDVPKDVIISIAGASYKVMFSSLSKKAQRDITSEPL